MALKCSTANTDVVLDYVDRLSSRVRIFAALISPRGLALLDGLGGDGYIDGGGIGATYAVPFFESVWAGDLDAAREYGRQWSRSHKPGWSLTSAASSRRDSRKLPAKRSPCLT